MDPALLTDERFWQAVEPFSVGRFPGKLPETGELLGCVLFETSGSTGSPKWLAISKAALQISAAAVNAHLQVDSASCWGLALPLQHVGGFGVVARATQSGSRFAAFTGRWNAAEFGAWLQAAHVTHTALVPTQIHDLVVAQRRAPPALIAVVVGGGRLDPVLGQAARDLGWPVLASYGMTEAASQIATQSLAELSQRYQAAPLAVLPIWQVAVGADERLELAGPALFRGQIILKEAIYQYIARSDGAYLTTDRVQLGPAGITPLGRADLRVKVLGELVDLAAIEQQLCELSHRELTAENFAVIAIFDERREHKLVPIFEKSLNRERVLSVLAEYQKNCLGFCRLEKPKVVDQLPRSALGKFARHSLVMHYNANFDF